MSVRRPGPGVAGVRALTCGQADAACPRRGRDLPDKGAWWRAPADGIHRTGGRLRAAPRDPARAGRRSLRLGGAYRLTEAGLAPLLARAPALEALALPQCSRLLGTFLAGLPRGLRRAPLPPPGALRCSCGALARGRQDAAPGRGVAGGCERMVGAWNRAQTLFELRLEGFFPFPLFCINSLACRGLEAPAASGRAPCAVHAARSAPTRAARRALDLSECRGVGRAALAAALPALPALADLALDGNPEADGALLAAAAAACPRLRRLSVAKCAGVAEAGLVALAGAAPGLAALVADDCGGVGDGALLALAEGCPRLEVRRRGVLPGNGRRAVMHVLQDHQ